jgi:hypothetical protein
MRSARLVTDVVAQMCGMTGKEAADWSIDHLQQLASRDDQIEAMWRAVDVVRGLLDRFYGALTDEQNSIQPIRHRRNRGAKALGCFAAVSIRASGHSLAALLLQLCTSPRERASNSVKFAPLAAFSGNALAAPVYSHVGSLNREIKCARWLQKTPKTSCPAFRHRGGSRRSRTDSSSMMPLADNRAFSTAGLDPNTLFALDSAKLPEPLKRLQPAATLRKPPPRAPLRRRTQDVLQGN